FDIDANGIVNVHAKDRATSKEQSITITGQSSLSKDQIDQMVRDAESHAEEDRQRKEEADARNRAETLVYQTEKVLTEQADKVPANEKADVESALVKVRNALNDNDVAAINAACDELMTASQTMSQSLYQQASAEADSGAGAGEGPSDDDVVEAEIIDEEQQ
ncbi:MAG: Hsp70 family protein, partial [Microthrixaceae bacterium]|nr:Hsp70 family protein [Microthrixaceae bacterium]